MNPLGRFMDPEAAKKKAVKKQFMAKIKEDFLAMVPEAVKPEVEDVSVTEMICGDPECAPVDTIIRIIYAKAPMRTFGIPREVEEVTDEDLKDFAPTGEVLAGWARGEDLDWPPLPDPGEPPELQLRFAEGARVECRVSATKWAPGTIMKQWYREPGWETGNYAPYQILLDNGKKIFAPQDTDVVIRALQDPTAQGGAEPMAQG